MTILSALFAGIDPLGTVKSVVTTVAVTAALGGAGAIYYKIATADKAVAELTKTVTTVTNTAIDLKHVVTAQPESAAVTNAVETKNEVVARKEEVVQQKKIVRVANKVKVIKADPALTPVQKDQVVAQTYINQLWTDYCDAGGDNTACTHQPEPTVDSSSPIKTEI